MTKLHQLVAIIEGNTGRKKVCGREITDIYQIFEAAKTSLTGFMGIAKTYKPLHESSTDVEDPRAEQFPAETLRVSHVAVDLLRKLREPWTRLIDTIATQDTANTQAKADIVVDDVVIAKDVPVTHLLFLEQQWTDLNTALDKIPTLPLGEEWTWSANSTCFATAPAQTSKIKKIMKPFVLYPATDKHPAQVEKTSDDIITGYWSTVRMSGAMPQQEKDKLIARIRKLLEATRKARTGANELQITDVKIADALFDYVLENKLPETK